MPPEAYATNNNLLPLVTELFKFRRNFSVLVPMDISVKSNSTLKRGLRGLKLLLVVVSLSYTSTYKEPPIDIAAVRTKKTEIEVIVPFLGNGNAIKLSDRVIIFPTNDNPVTEEPKLLITDIFPINPSNVVVAVIVVPPELNGIIAALPGKPVGPILPVGPTGPI